MRFPLRRFEGDVATGWPLSENWVYLFFFRGGPSPPQKKGGFLLTHPIVKTPLYSDLVGLVMKASCKGLPSSFLAPELSSLPCKRPRRRSEWMRRRGLVDVWFFGCARFLEPRFLGLGPQTLGKLENMVTTTPGSSVAWRLRHLGFASLMKDVAASNFA